ncbi:hypothetical protein HK098_000836 [Nowakowskiella sp. JEL0407]|nr:hypothetical protein HK098_000836 [Nowakowskiella sp. JEL0407]
MASEYEKQREINIQRNREILRELGLFNNAALTGSNSASTTTSTTLKKKKKSTSQSNDAAKKKRSTSSSTPTSTPASLSRRKSSRLESKPAKSFKSYLDSDDEDNENDGEFKAGNDSDNESNFSENSDEPVEEIYDQSVGFSTGSRRKNGPKLPPFVPPAGRAQVTDDIIGSIDGIKVGTKWESRIACWYDGVHRTQISGIQGNKKNGCFSIALSGGYEDDIDNGDMFTFTGQGGRDLKGTKDDPKNLRTAPQSKDQELKGGNLALKVSFENQNPVRVIRGYKLDSVFAPLSGYRYDGLYKVAKFWQDTGLSGFKVYKYALVRLPGQPPIPRRDKQKKRKNDDGNEDKEQENEEGDENAIERRKKTKKGNEENDDDENEEKDERENENDEQEEKGDDDENEDEDED